jgi:cytochrome c-type biogenesis protein CcmH
VLDSSAATCCSWSRSSKRTPPSAPGAATATPGQAAISGRVTLSQALKDNVAPNDTVFIFARAAQGPRMPLAIVRKQVKDLPATFSLDDSTAMNEQARLSEAGDVIVTARVSRSGSAMPASGDLQGESGVVRPGAKGVAVSIDQVVP